MSAIITWLLAEALPWIVGAAGVAAGLFGLYRSGKSRGRTEAKTEQANVETKQREKANAVDREVDALDDDAMRRRADEHWVRGDRR